MRRSAIQVPATRLRSGAQVGLRELERKAQVDRQLYEFFLQRYSELGEQSQVMTPDARVISVAKPPSTPSSLSPRLFSLIGFSISLFAGGLLALVLDGLDRRVRGARQIEQLFGIKVLESVPQIGGRRERGQYRYLLQPSPVGLCGSHPVDLHRDPAGERRHAARRYWWCAPPSPPRARAPSC